MRQAPAYGLNVVRHAMHVADISTRRSGRLFLSLQREHGTMCLPSAGILMMPLPRVAVQVRRR